MPREFSRRSELAREFSRGSDLTCEFSRGSDLTCEFSHGSDLACEFSRGSELAREFSRRNSRASPLPRLRRSAAELRCRDTSSGAPPALAATSAGALNMQAPTTTPTISAMASRSSSAGSGRPVVSPLVGSQYQYDTYGQCPNAYVFIHQFHIDYLLVRCRINFEAYLPCSRRSELARKFDDSRASSLLHSVAPEVSVTRHIVAQLKCASY